MKIIDIDVNHPYINTEPILLCLGFFDGLHLGHQYLIKQALNEGYPVGVLTFDNSPAYILGKKSKYCLSSIYDKAEFLQELNVSYLFIMHFDQETLKVTKDEFIESILKPLNPIGLYCGEDYRFGTRGLGDPSYLSRFFKVNVIPLQSINGIKISSRVVRDYLSNGEVEYANKILGRPYKISGLVVDGLHNGRKINFPTANLSLDYDYILPLEGVYLGYATYLNERKKALITISRHPTISQLEEPIVEVHIIDFDGNIYGKQLYAEFTSYLRGINKFSSLEELKKQILIDEEIAKKTLK